MDNYPYFSITKHICDQTSEPSRRDGSNEGSQHMFSLRNKKNYLCMILNTTSYLEDCYSNNNDNYFNEQMNVARLWNKSKRGNSRNNCLPGISVSAVEHSTIFHLGMSFDEFDEWWMKTPCKEQRLVCVYAVWTIRLIIIFLRNTVKWIFVTL